MKRSESLADPGKGWDRLREAPEVRETCSVKPCPDRGVWEQAESFFFPPIFIPLPVGFFFSPGTPPRFLQVVAAVGMARGARSASRARAGSAAGRFS